MIAHLGGVPLEEILPTVTVTGAGAGLLLARARLTLYLRRRQSVHSREDA